MVFSDWIQTLGMGSNIYLDPVTKYAGNSSCKFYVRGQIYQVINCYLTHNLFSQPNAQLVFRFYSDSLQSKHIPYIHHASYGYVPISHVYRNASIWEKFKVSFWYDISTNTRWGRLEKYIGNTWVQQGNDINFGLGVPPSNTIRLRATTNSTSAYFSCWFDEIEVYS